MASLERELTKIYRQARDDIGRKWYDYFEKTEKQIAAKEKEVEFIRNHGTKEEIEQAERELINAKKNFTLRNDYYKDMVDETTSKLAEVNQIAAAYTNGQLPSYYQEAFNSEMQAEAVDLGFKFNMADEATVRRRVMDGDIQLPAKKVNIPKDERWNTKAINSNVLQGIIQGESVDKIAKRLEPIMDNNKNAALRNARTLVNGAENQGRQDRYEDLEKQGAIMKKVWIATGDSRTRDWHLEMDGQEVDIHEDFVDGNGNELEYPGDPKAAPETVYNCRCTMKSKIVGFKKADGTIINLKDYGGSELHKEEIRQEIERREAVELEKEQKKQEYSEEIDKIRGELLAGDGRDKPEYLDYLYNSGIYYLPVEEYDKIPSEQEIIEKLAGGDKTKGSCGSLAWAYAGNKAGYDVTDYRGEDSRVYFSKRLEDIERWRSLGADVTVIRDGNDVASANKLLKQMEKGKEYILETGKHAAVVRATENGYEYLEMQSSYSTYPNGWHKFESNTLKWRFAAQKSHTIGGHKVNSVNALIDIDSISKSKDYQETLGYINTATGAQKKGAGGNVR